MRVLRKLAAPLALLCLAAAPRVSLAQSISTFHNGADRAGAYVVPGLTYAAAARLHPDPAFRATVSGEVYVQPLYWKPSAAQKGLIIVATEQNVVHALDENTGAEVWKTALPRPAPHSTLGCGSIDPEGVTGTPVIDPATGTLYLDALVLGVGKTPKHRLYALSLANGAVLPHWPIDVENRMAAYHQTFSSKYQGQRSALLLQGGRLYVTYGGRAGDCLPYHGVVMEVAVKSRITTGVWATRADRGGIWSEGGVTSDGSSLFVTTGNTANTTGWGDGEAVFRLLPGLERSTVARNFFAPSNWKYLDANDRDLGGTAAVPFTVPAAGGPARRILALGKEGYAYLLDADDLGGFEHELAKFPVTASPVLAAPAVYKTASATLVAIPNRGTAGPDCSGINLSVLKVTSDPEAPVTLAWCALIEGYGQPIVTTTNGTDYPIFWLTGAGHDNEIHGFNALTGKVVFSGKGTAMKNLRHFGTAIAANGHLYVVADGTVYAFAF
jgi:outer membrane protein assembly factor BamB